jgi:hypothetical protein
MQPSVTEAGLNMNFKLSTIYKEKVGINFSRKGSRDLYVTTSYLVLKTIEYNPNITLNQLEWVLSSEFMLSLEDIRPALVTMCNKNLLGFVSRWNQTGTDVTHYRLRSEKSNEKLKWEESALTEFPELTVIVPPTFSKNNRVG